MHQVFIDSGYENASPLAWQQSGESRVDLVFHTDHQRFSPNRQCTHMNFKVRVTPEAVGSRLEFHVAQVTGCWNGMEFNSFGTHDIYLAVSADGQSWTRIPTQKTGDEQFPIRFELLLSGPCIQVARCVPYTETDLRRLLQDIGSDPLVRVACIGRSVEGRELELVELGPTVGDYRLFLRARAHPWEPGGNWLVEGLARELLGPQRDLLQRLRVSIMPMAAKDGVWRGWTRFNSAGADLNRSWSSEAGFDPAVAPEAACLLGWFEVQHRQGTFPHLSIDIHNDQVGRLMLCPRDKAPQGYYGRMERLERLLREASWFREGIAPVRDRGGFGFSDGIASRFGADAAVWELNSEWALGLDRSPLHLDWIEMGRGFASALRRYFLG